MKRTITFDKTLAEDMLSIFDKKINEERLIVEKSDNQQKVLSPDGETINLDEFAGITQGSEIFVKTDLISLIDYSKGRKY